MWDGRISCETCAYYNVDKCKPPANRPHIRGHIMCGDIHCVEFNKWSLDGITTIKEWHEIITAMVPEKDKSQP